MQIPNNLPNCLMCQLDETSQSQGGDARPSGNGQPVAEGSNYSPAPELVHLFSLVRQTPEVRSDRLQQVGQRLAAGDYLTPQAADQTAAALLDAQ